MTTEQPNATTTVNRAARILEHIEHQFAYKAESIKSDCLHLIRRLERAIENCDLAIAGQPYSINECGEVQSAGGEIDRACAQLATLSNVIGMVRYAAGPDQR